MLAGLAALGVTFIRAIAGGATDFEPLLATLDGNDLRGVVIINWHALTIIFGILSLSLFTAVRLSSASRVVIGSISALAFGAVCVLFMVVTAMETGSPFTYPPFILLGVVSLLSAAAAWSARG